MLPTSFSLDFLFDKIFSICGFKPPWEPFLCESRMPKRFCGCFSLCPSKGDEKTLSNDNESS